MRYIDADALKDELIECTPYAIDPVYRNTNSNIDMFTLMEMLDELPAADVVPVVRGEWIDSPTGNYAICSHCHVEWNVFDNDTYRFRHCPACGAKMEDKP